jgi:hypothetical protein
MIETNESIFQFEVKEKLPITNSAMEFLKLS